jgi:hypothetical protein
MKPYISVACTTKHAYLAVITASDEPDEDGEGCGVPKVGYLS